MSLPRCKHYFKKLQKFSVCALKAEKGWIGIEPEPDSFGVYHYVYYGSSKIGIPFKEESFTVSSNQFFSMKDKLHLPVLLESLEDFYMIGFNHSFDVKFVFELTLKFFKVLLIDSSTGFVATCEPLC